VDFCARHDLVIGGTIFPHKDCHKVTWVSPDNKTENQIEHCSHWAKMEAIATGCKKQKRCRHWKRPPSCRGKA
jgi:hypothetical protein